MFSRWESEESWSFLFRTVQDLVQSRKDIMVIPLWIMKKKATHLCECDHTGTWRPVVSGA